MPGSKPWERYAAQPVADNQPDAVVVGRPNPMIQAREDRAVRSDLRAQQDSDRAEERFRIQQEQQASRDRHQTIVDDRAATTAARADVVASRLPTDKEKALREMVGSVSSLGRANSGFRDDYLGFGSGIENTMQAYTGFGTPGQRDWWADFRATDNLARNELYGASLTAGEKSAYAATTITPDMSPEQARKNIARREQIARSGLSRYRDYLLASGYGKDAIGALVGTALDSPQGGSLTRQDDQPGASPVGKEFHPLSVDSVADFATGLSGGDYSIERDGLFYTPRGGGVANPSPCPTMWPTAPSIGRPTRRNSARHQPFRFRSRAATARPRPSRRSCLSSVGMGVSQRLRTRSSVAPRTPHCSAARTNSPRLAGRSLAAGKCATTCAPSVPWTPTTRRTTPFRGLADRSGAAFCCLWGRLGVQGLAPRTWRVLAPPMAPHTVSAAAKVRLATDSSRQLRGQ